MLIQNGPKKSHYAKLLERRSDRISNTIHLDERIRTAPSSETIRYILGAMLPVDIVYTQNTIKEANRIQNQLEKNMPSHLPMEFGHQGSVTNNTHIRLYSDIDLLGITKTYWTLKPPLFPDYPWNGDPLAHLADTRRNAIAVIENEFPEAEIDIAKGNAIGVSGGSLSRAVDVVICNWFDTQEYRIYGVDWRGIQVYDSENHVRVSNFPFLHNRRIDEKDRATNGNARKVIRFVKSVKADADREIDVSSYDITGLVWNIPDHFIAVPSGDELKLVTTFYHWGQLLLTDANMRSGMKVPNGTRDLFGEGGTSLDQLKLLLAEIEPMLPDVQAAKFYGLRTAAPRVIDLFRELA